MSCFNVMILLFLFNLFKSNYRPTFATRFLKLYSNLVIYRSRFEMDVCAFFKVKKCAYISHLLSLRANNGRERLITAGRT